MVLVNVGCGMSPGASWKNFDSSLTLWFERLPAVGKLYTKNKTRFPANVRYGNISAGPLVTPGTADAVYCSHMIEHVPLEDMRAALANIHSMLKSGGVFRLIVPNLALLISDYQGSSNRLHRPCQDPIGKE